FSNACSGRRRKGKSALFGKSIPEGRGRHAAGDKKKFGCYLFLRGPGGAASQSLRPDAHHFSLVNAFGGFARWG
ncbi:MAG TPA: hypothetical protein VF654_15335, partial [Pyrinomonadaceae bacterium]